MKKFFLTGLFFVLFGSCCFANEMTEDYLDIATNYCINGNYKEAVNYLNKILAIEPNNKDISDLKNGLTQIMQNKSTSFIVQKSNAVKQSVIAKQKGDKKFEQEALTLGNDYLSYYFLGEFYRQNKDYNQAITYFIKSVNAKPVFTQCYLKIASCYYELKNYKQAETYINQYLKINPEDDFAYALKSKILLASGDTNSALSEILTAIVMNNSLEYRFLECKILYNMRRYAQAEKKLKLLSEEVQTAELYKYLGLCQVQLENYADAVINLEKALLLSDDDKELNKKYSEIKIKVENGTT